MREFTGLAFLFFVVLMITMGASAQSTLHLTSPDFPDQGNIPREFTCQGTDISPTLKIEGVPAGTRTLALIVDDPDAPGKIWVHWVVFNIPPATAEIKSGVNPGTQGRNDFGTVKYGGPCPPSGTHRYMFKLYALDTYLNLSEGIRKRRLEEAMEGHILQQTVLTGLYNKSW